jgi:PIN domain nuclease of toxin-antitoxin system
MSVPTRKEGERSPSLLLDTHALIWLLSGDTRLGKRTASAIEKESTEDRVLLSAITPWEIGLLASKKRIELHRDPLQWIHAALANPGISLVPLHPEIAVASTHLPFDMHPDPADRIIVATARHLGAVLVTADQALLQLSKKGHFRAVDAAR